jgi:hypothetical protein
MADAPYLVALALLERGGQRALPLTGQSQPAAAAAAADPGSLGHTLALELLLRLWQQSALQPLRRIDADASLLLVELPLEGMSEQLPQLKADWLNSGDTAAFHQALRQLALRGWTIQQARYEPIRFLPW